MPRRPGVLIGRRVDCVCGRIARGAELFRHEEEASTGGGGLARPGAPTKRESRAGVRCGAGRPQMESFYFEVLHGSRAAGRRRGIRRLRPSGCDLF